MFDIFTCILAAIFFIFIGYCPSWQALKLQHFKSKEIQNIPGPLSLPILGTSWLFTFGKYHVSKIPQYYEEMREKYGTIFKEEALFNVPVISVFAKADIEKVFRSSGKYPIRPPTEAIAKYRREHPERYASTGLTNEQGKIICMFKFKLEFIYNFYSTSVIMKGNLKHLLLFAIIFSAESTTCD